jgi:hypothetical protein
MRAGITQRCELTLDKFRVKKESTEQHLDAALFPLCKIIFIANIRQLNKSIHANPLV